MKTIESIRHGDKVLNEDGSYGQDLSFAGKENAKNKALDYFNEIKESPEGSVFVLTSSDVERAIETKNVIGDNIKELIKNNKDIEVLSVNNIEGVDQAKDKNKKYIVTDVAPSSLIGFSAFRESIKYFNEISNKYGEEKELFVQLMLKSWMAKGREQDNLKKEIDKNEIKGIDLNDLDPLKFKITPEYSVILYFKYLKRISEIMDNHFPNKPWKILQVGHDIQLDFASMFLLDGEISLESLQKIGGFRAFLEPSQIKIENNKLSFSFKGVEKELGLDFNEILKQLEDESADRKLDWSKNKNYENFK